MRFTRTFHLTVAALATLASSLYAQMPQLATYQDGSTLKITHKTVAPHDHTNGQAHARFGINGIDSVPNFNGHYMTPGYTASNVPQKEWYYNTIGNPPQLGGTTTLNAPIVPVNLVLLNANGSVYFTVQTTPAMVNNVLGGPVFSNTSFNDSNVPTQVTDAVQRAEYFKSAKADWHTMLAPSVKTTRTMAIPYGKYTVYAYSNHTYAFTVVDYSTFGNLLFPATQTDTTTPIGAAENAGEMTTKDVSTFLFNNVYLAVNADINNCCVLGYHTYDVEPGDASNGNKERRYVVNYSSWISPGLFGAGFSDITANSHEVAESFNDPFVASDNVHNVTPIWLSPNGNCQNNLEDGDVIEGLPSATYPITMNGYTYHPQNEALLQWFEFQTNPDSFQGAYSYPNTSTLTTLSPGPLNNNCQVQN